MPANNPLIVVGSIGNLPNGTAVLMKKDDAEDIPKDLVLFAEVTIVDSTGYTYGTGLLRVNRWGFSA